MSGWTCPRCSVPCCGWRRKCATSTCRMPRLTCSTGPTSTPTWGNPYRTILSRPPTVAHAPVTRPAPGSSAPASPMEVIMSPVSPCVPIASEIELRSGAERPRKFRNLAEDDDDDIRDLLAHHAAVGGRSLPRQHQATPSSGRSGSSSSRTRSCTAQPSRAQRSLDQANEKLHFAMETLATIQAEGYRESSGSPATVSPASAPPGIESLATALTQDVSTGKERCP